MQTITGYVISHSIRQGVGRMYWRMGRKGGWFPRVDDASIFVSKQTAEDVAETLYARVNAYGGKLVIVKKTVTR